MLTFVSDWLIQRGFDTGTAALWTLAADVVMVLALAVVANVIAKRVVVGAVLRLTSRTATVWDDLLAKRRVFQRLSHLAPAIVIYHFAPAVLASYPSWIDLARQGALVYMLLIGVSVVASLLNAVLDIAPTTSLPRDLPLKSFVQVAKIIIYGIAAIWVIALVIGQSPFLLLSGLGAMAAVLMLIFRDAILGLVAGVQLSANRMVAPGDWIEMPKYGVDGDVLEVALTTVKVQNFDKTIVTIPTYSLISESFKNWRGMSESGGRRIKRAITLDLSSVRFCDDAMLERLSKIQYLGEYLKEKQQEVAAWNAERGVDPSSRVNGRRLTNIGTFRAYIVRYLRNHPMIHDEMTFLVRQLAPTEHGLPIEIYVFSRDQDWGNYEDIQSDIFDHLLAAAPEFDLRVYQRPAGSDVQDALGTSGPR